jgi:hypothetical protein
MTSKAISLLFLILCALLCTCSDDNNNPTFPFERSVLDVSVVKRCKDGTFKPGTNCYLMRWQHPIEKKDLQRYYIWIDTTVVKDSDQKISQSQMEQATSVIDYNNKSIGDSLDLTNLIKEFLERDSLHIAIWAKYSGSEQGAVQHMHVYFGDDVSPAMVSFSDSVISGTIWISWTRPTDQRDFYFPEITNGPIAGYNITIKAETADPTEDIRNSTLYASLAGDYIKPTDLKRSQVFYKDGRGVKLKGVNEDDSKTLRYAIVDGKGFSDNIEENNWKVEITGLKPEHKYNINIIAYDSAGNSSIPNNESKKTTDGIPPLIASKFWLYPDSGDGLPRLDSNRLILFWPRSVDPLTNAAATGIQLDSRLDTKNYRLGIDYAEVEKYLIEQWNGVNWDSVPRGDFIVHEGYYNTRYRLENNSMKFDENGEFVSDTLRWVLPGDTIRLRIRAIDSSGYYSKAWIETIAVSKGEFWQNTCPPNFVPVKMDPSTFCMEKLHHISENKFEQNILHREAKERCENLGYHLCTEQEWNAACTSNGSKYGVIEERNFSPDKFLFGNCGVGTGNSIDVNNIAKRNKICTSPDGVRDLPGQLQEWVTGKDDDGKEIPLLKGTSYAIFEGISRVELAQCKNKFTPTRIRPRYTTDSVYLYRSGSRIDTLLTRDTLRTIYAILKPDSLPDTLLVYNLKSTKGDLLGFDYVDKKEYRRRGGNEWLKELWKGLKYEPKEELRVLILGAESMKILISGADSIAVSNFFLDPTVGFRCCAQVNTQ